MKVFSTLLVSILFACIGQAQKTVSIGAGPSYSFVVNEDFFSYYFSNGLGGTISVNYHITKLGAISGSLRIISNRHKELKRYITFKDLKTGYKTYFLRSQCFVGIEGGLRFRKDPSNPSFLIAGLLGYSFPLSKKSQIDVFTDLNYLLSTPDLSRFGTINLVYKFHFKHKRNSINR